jgi:hypothetical protein
LSLWQREREKKKKKKKKKKSNCSGKIYEVPNRSFRN